jgi:hypothetical protein
VKVLWKFVGAAVSAVLVAVLITPPQATAVVPLAGYWTESAYTSVFKDSEPSADADSAVRLDMARNEYEAGQIVVRRNEAFTIGKVAFTDLTGAAGSISAANLEYKFVEFTQLNANSVFGGNQYVYPVTRKAPGLFPDGLSNEPTMAVSARDSQPIWVRVFVPGSTPGGLYRGTATVQTDRGDIAVPIEADVRAVTLPDASNGSYTNVMWQLFFGDLSSQEYAVETVKKYYGHDKYSAGWWALMDNVAKEWKAHRTNNLTVPMTRVLLDGGSKLNADGTYQFDWSRFDQLVQFFLDRGTVKRIEGFWLNGGPGYSTKWDVEIIDAAGKRGFVPWDSAEANRWIDQYTTALKAHLDAKGWTGKWWMHIGDEPQGDHGEQAWTGIANRIRGVWPSVQLGDAAFHEPWASRLATRADILIPNLLNYNTGPGPYDAEHANGKELWLYNCNIPTMNYLNRFVDQPQWSQRQTAWFGYSRGASGYLHWAFNNWQYAIDDQPEKGDGYIVLPDPANNTIRSTVRYESLRDGIEDYEVLNLLGKRDPELARDLAASMVPDADTYTPDTGFMIRIRRLALDAAEGRSLTDLAHSATATATSGTARSAIDGDPATVWQPVGSGSLRLDLGRQTQVDAIALTWSPNAAVKLEVSYDGARWTDAAARPRATALNLKTRYLRLTTTGGLGTVEVYGSPLAAQNLAGGRSVLRSENPNPSWPDSTGIESTDGVLADAHDDGRTYGYAGTDGETRTIELTIDLGSVKRVDKARIHAYEEYPAYRPDSVKVLTSVDGTRFVQRGAGKEVNGSARIWYDVRFGAAPARYLKYVLTKRFSTDGGVMLVDELEAYEAPPGPANLAWGRNYTKSAAPDAAYPDAGMESTDGLGAGGYTDGLGYGYHLAAGETKSVDVIIDLGSARQVSVVRAAAFADGVHDYRPDSVKVLSGSTVLAESTQPSDGWFQVSYGLISTRTITVRFAKTEGYSADYLFLDDINVHGPASTSLVAQSYKSTDPKDPPYPDNGSESTDGILGVGYTDGLSYGWHLAAGETRTVDLDLDLGSAKALNQVSLREYADGSHDYKPGLVVVLTSVNGTDYVERARTSSPTSRWFDLAFTAVDARYVKVRATKTYGSFADYLFLDEVTLQGA